MGIKVWHGSVRSNAVRLGRARHGSGFRARYGPVYLGGLWWGCGGVVQGKGFVAGCGRVLCGAVSHGLLWCGRDFAARRGDAWFAQVWSRKVWQGRGFMARSGIF
jgi:hypothetical protein